MDKERPLKEELRLIGEMLLFITSGHCPPSIDSELLTQALASHLIALSA